MSIEQIANPDAVERRLKEVEALIYALETEAKNLAVRRYVLNTERVALNAVQDAIVALKNQ